jgi:hypothetical protein
MQPSVHVLMIAYAVAALCRYNAAPTAIHMTAAVRLLRYLKATARHKLVYRRTTAIEPLVEHACKSSDNLVDVMTKALHTVQHDTLTRAMGLRPGGRPMQLPRAEPLRQSE